MSDPISIPSSSSSPSDSNSEVIPIARPSSLEENFYAERLLEGIQTRQAQIGIIGLGYVGLPLARTFYKAGFQVEGFDIDATKVEILKKGQSYIRQISNDWISEGVEAGRFSATADFRALRNMHIIIICVPTPLTPTREPDLSYIRATAEKISKYLDRGQLVILESTTYPGTTEEVVLPILEESGLQLGSDFFLAFSPEREDPGNLVYNTQSIPKLVGGVDAWGGYLATEAYAQAIKEVVPVSDAKIAEAAKILENIYRSVNIALVNELKTLFDRMDIDIWEVIQAAATKPFGFQAFYPGPGLGGHCIPIDPFYLSWKAREKGITTRFIELAGEINTQMPEYVVSRTQEALDRRGKTLSGSRGLIIGMSYKKDIDDLRESPAFEVLSRLTDRGAQMDYHDPFFPTVPPTRKYKLEMTSVPLNPDTLQSFDFCVIITDHTRIDWQQVVDHSSLIIDTRNITHGLSDDRDHIVKA